jgi:hypothetical protein
VTPAGINRGPRGGFGFGVVVVVCVVVVVVVVSVVVVSVVVPVVSVLVAPPAPATGVERRKATKTPANAQTPSAATDTARFTPAV